MNSAVWRLLRPRPTLYYMPSEIQIDGMRLPLEAPASVDAYAARVGELIAAGQAVYPVGGGTALDFGKPPSKAGVGLSLANLNRVVDYPVRDLTITLEAGILVAEVQRLLVEQNQRLPVEVPQPDRATLGGAVSANAFGPRRLSNGTFRDHVIGITVVNDSGELCSAGGRVVKNVAGYDLAKLYTGALGTLGIITQLTLKLQPMPPASTWIAAPLASSHLAAALDRIHQSATRSAAVEVMNSAAVQTNGDFLLGVLFEDSVEAVTWQIEQLTTELKLPFQHVDDATFERQLIDSPAVVDCGLAILASTQPSQVANLLTALNQKNIRLHAHAMSGIVRIGMANTDFATAQHLHLQALNAAHAGDGNAIIRRCDPEWKSKLQVWGRAPAGAAAMRKVKEQFDPRDLLNSGRRDW